MNSYEPRSTSPRGRNEAKELYREAIPRNPVQEGGQVKDLKR